MLPRAVVDYFTLGTKAFRRKYNISLDARLDFWLHSIAMDAEMRVEPKARGGVA